MSGFYSRVIMAMDDGIKDPELFEDDEVKQKVTDVWARVFEASNRVIHQANNYGFLGMDVIPSPNIHAMLVTLQIFSSVIDILITHAEKLTVGYDEIRLLLNAKEQITRMERIAAALKANNRADFNSALEQLERQAPF